MWHTKVRKASGKVARLLVQFKTNRTLEDSEMAKEGTQMAKRNKKKARESRSGTSPYVKYGKTPYRYSADYYEWKARATGKAARYGA